MDESLKIPQHVAIILDGNGRWAKAKGMPRNYGHVQGAKTVEVICEEAYKMGVQYLTVYAFSTENWNRPKDEVDALMKLLRNYMKTCLTTAAKNRMCVRIIGDKTRLDPDLQERIAELEEATKNNDGLHFQVTINYGGRDELVRAVKKIAAKVEAGEISADGIDEALVNDNIDTHGIPDPDLL
ncbi:MAG: di-trans,poly-cis-decaprenylcistransferase, partial [Lachnospiraceae bacterium]|nr:di-trans,poly-cis-decaprenylcistransferase [Lachnospiraceae bacterium]